MSRLESTISQELKEDLECPVCKTIPRTIPIYQCVQGHSHCKACHPKLQHCPVCRSAIGNIRALMTEKVIAKLPRTCKNYKIGCRQSELIPRKMLEHEKVCQYRPIECVKPNCTSKFPMFMTLAHLARKHPEVDRTSRSSIAAFAQFALHQRLLHSYSMKDRFMFVRFLPTWKQELEPIEQPIQELCDSLRQVLHEKNGFPATYTADQNDVLRINLNLLFLERFDTCPDFPIPRVGGNSSSLVEKEKAFLKMLRTLPQEDQEMFVNLLPSWKQALHEDALAYPIDELCEAIKQALREQNESMTELNRNQKAALRIQVNLLFLEKYGICPDDPWTITY